MPRCGCADSCSCLVVAGDGISVEGIGTLERPYEITSESADLIGRVEFTDDGNVDFTTTGVGTLNDPLTVFADAVLSTRDLTDVPDTFPEEGQVLVWRLNGWEYEDQSGGGGSGVPPGGLTGEVLTKLSNADGDADWEPISGDERRCGGGADLLPPPVGTGQPRRSRPARSRRCRSTRWSTRTAFLWNVGANSRFDIPVDGYYQIDAVVTYQGNNSTGRRGTPTSTWTPGCGDGVGGPHDRRVTVSVSHLGDGQGHRRAVRHHPHA